MSLIPNAWDGLYVDDDNLESITKLSEWTRDQTSLYLWGGTGTGKTTIARCAILDFCRVRAETLADENEAIVLWLPESRLVAAMESFDTATITRAWDVECLVIDDVASRPFTKRQLTAYRDLFDAREQGGGKLLLTGQKKPNELLSVWRDETGIREDIAYRLRSILNSHAVEVRGDNRRRRNG